MKGFLKGAARPSSKPGEDQEEPAESQQQQQEQPTSNAAAAPPPPSAAAASKSATPAAAAAAAAAGGGDSDDDEEGKGESRSKMLQRHKKVCRCVGYAFVPQLLATHFVDSSQFACTHMLSPTPTQTQLTQELLAHKKAVQRMGKKSKVCLVVWRLGLCGAAAVASN